VLPALTLLLLLVLPGSKYLWFDGLPLSNWPERVALLLLIFNAVPRSTRTRFRELLSHRSMHGWGGTLLLIVLVAKLWSYFAFPLGGGFEVCLRSLYSPVASCEKSYEGLFLTRDGVNALGSITRTDDLINFGPIDRSRPDTDQDTAGSTWNLPFSNDFPRFSELWLDRLPFTADIGTRLHAERDSYLPIALVGELKVVYSKGSRGELGTSTLEFSSYEGEQRVFVPISEGAGVLRLRYEFKEGAIGAIPDAPPTAAGPYATLTLFDLVTQPTSRAAEFLQPVPRDDPNGAQGAALLTLNLAIAAVLLGALIWVATPRKLFIGALVTVGTASTFFIIDRTLRVGSSFPILLMVASTIGVYLVTCRYGNLSRWMSAFVVSLGAAPVVIGSTAQRINGLASALPWDHIMFRGRDSDWLVYQGYARQILLDQSLRGGEATFYFIPGMRYVTFLQHLLLGDSDLIIAVSVFVVLLATTLLIIEPRLERSGVLPLVVATSLVATWLRPLILELVTNGAAEPIAWITLLGGMLMMLTRHEETFVRLSFSAGLLSCAVFLRPNLLFAVIAMLLWQQVTTSHGLMSSARRIRALLIAVSVLALAFFHNLHFGESSAPFTSFVTLDREFTISEILRSPFDSNLRSVLSGKIRLALAWMPATRNLGVVLTAWVMQAVWIFALVAFIRRRARLHNLLLFCVPLIYLFSMLPFRYTTIAERHFVALSMFFGISSLVITSPNMRRSSD